MPMDGLWQAIIKKVMECDPEFAVVVIGVVLFLIFAARFLISRGSTPRRYKAALGKNRVLERDAELMTLAAQASELVTRNLLYLATKRSEDPRRTWNHVWHTLVSMTGSVMSRSKQHETTVILFARQDQDDLVPAISFNLSAEIEENLSLPALASLAGDSLMHGTLEYCDDTSKDPRFPKPAKARRKYRSVACAAVVRDGQVVAVLYVDAMPVKAFSDLDLRHLQGMAGLAGHIAVAGNDSFGLNVIDLVGATAANQAAPAEEGQTGHGQGDEPSRKGAATRRAPGQGPAGRHHDRPVRG